jgi:hypothetical protein
LAAFGFLIDGLAVVLPPVVCQAQGLLARLTGWGIWLSAIAMSLLALSGWSSQLIGDAVQARAIEATSTDSVLQRLGAFQNARKVLTEVRSVNLIDAALKAHCDRACHRDLAIARAAAEQRDSTPRSLSSAYSYPLPSRLGLPIAVPFSSGHGCISPRPGWPA